MAEGVRRGRGVYEAEHTMGDGRPWLYAADRYGRQVGWLPYEAGNEQQRERVIARLWRTLNRRDPLPTLQVIRGGAPDRPGPSPSLPFPGIDPEKLIRAVVYGMRAHR